MPSCRSAPSRPYSSAKRSEDDDVLPERVVRHEDALLGAVREHRVGPVHHRHRQERHRPPAEVDDVALFHGLDDEAVVVLGDVADAGDGRHHARLRDGRHDVGQAAVVIGLAVIDDDVRDLGKVDDRGDARQQLGHERRLHRVDERDARLALHEVGVVGRAVGRLEAVEVAEAPVDGADPPDVLAHLNRTHAGLLSDRQRAYSLIPNGGGKRGWSCWIRG